MTHLTSPPAQRSLIGHLLQILRSATLERLALPDVEGKEMDEHILLESYLVRTPPELFAAPKAPFL
ncbi:hypothetical protein ACSBLW_00345 [Thioclava sp. FR2]|uniref:hypothetical protein n=1 Tax=Thioclava sp. FR2 TaxID=3445780 RepID=UPI003EBD37FE